jgi:16S rRNA (uracil1498-N3)-methyltransferase
MRLNRVYIDLPLAADTAVTLPAEVSHHIGRVLRMRPGQSLQIFNGTGGYYDAAITSISKRAVEVLTAVHHTEERESALHMVLAQGLSRGQHMDYTVQKAVELGVSRIIPLLTEYSNVQLSEERTGNRLQHWMRIIIHACEQSGRNRLPELSAPVHFSEWVQQEHQHLKLVLDPEAEQSFARIKHPTSGLIIMSGPEGGFSEGEIRQAMAHDFINIRIGPRILRTETAAVAAMSAAQMLWGDMG